MSQTFDVIVIGSGPAGQKAALCAAKLGKRVALIDRVESLGGVCIHTGTIPSKAMREAVLHLTGMNLRQVYGESYAVKDNITMGDLLYRCQHVVRTETEVIRTQMRRNRVSLFFGHASFVDPHTIKVTRIDGETQELEGDHILVAVGSPASTGKSRTFTGTTCWSPSAPSRPGPPTCRSRRAG